MQQQAYAAPGGHNHDFLGRDHGRNERRIWVVVALTASMMVVEIVAGTVYGSMALVADGFHMSTHAAAMLIAAGAYFYARKYSHDARFSFGTGKLGDLAGFASAVILALIALFIGYESVLRLAAPVPISFGQAISVAAIGLLVNLVSAWLLRDDHAHHHHHDHSHTDHSHGRHRHEEGGRDHNLRAAYLHVLADALTSVLAIVALAFGSLYGWIWLDPMMGIVGALIIARWSWGLMRDAGRVLVDYLPESDELPREIREAIEAEGDRITDLHVWQVGPGHHAAIVSLVTERPRPVAFYRRKLAHLRDLSHLTVEIDALRRN
ncbi:CDF family Co(II)/Ni(II) efflux transporter DmeF [Aquamicrobium sp. LC103]|uniref:CDF family Co(II)/Ni(II) efflux transporter DmeF n=1 Tax=Aquamicrobium sp. LC103 TaxID=1120658 RepID=UPI00063E7753|nr:CDF family Co(II)/Ni(II) efflux transporter DmeF [Aquamicrobium sp. LC103]TKT74918.1 CDF family Co(II)/Ni(II) efflux transporter DmeF [Aquamicrobium sp. LC103]